MTTYVYETIPSNPGEKPRLFEIQQKMTEAPLALHPETGERIRRVILGGYGLIKQDAKSSGGSCCTPGSGCC